MEHCRLIHAQYTRVYRNVADQQNNQETLYEDISRICYWKVFSKHFEQTLARAIV